MMNLLPLAPERASRLVSAFSRTHVLVIGDAMLDTFLVGRVTRISPEAPVPVVAFQKQTHRIGGAANVAHNITALGGHATLIGVIGQDDNGKTLTRGCREAGIEAGFLAADSDRVTTTKVRIVTERNQQVARVDYESDTDISGDAEHGIITSIQQNGADASAIVVSDYLKGCITRRVIAAAVELARQRDIPLLVDPKIPHIDYYAGATVITPNQHEAETATHMRIRSSAEARIAARAFRDRARCGAVLITRGDHGMWLLEPDTEGHLPASAREVADVTGAGDTVIATMGLALAAGGTFVEAAHLANTAAGLVVAKFGAAVILLLHQQVRHLDYVPDLGDPLFSIWRVGWVNHQLLSDPRHLFDTNIFYPERLTLTFSDPIVLPALTAAPVLALGVHPLIVYNLLLLSGFWFSGIAVYLLVVRLTGSARAAFVAGLVYACALYRFDHYSHLELQMMQWMPLGLLALHLLTGRDPGSGIRDPEDRKRWWYAFALAIALVAQLYSSMYYAVFFVVYAAVIGAGLLIVHRPSLRQLVLPLLVSAAVAAIAALPLVRAFVAAEPIKGQRGLNEIAAFSAVPSDYLRVSKVNLLWGRVLRPPRAERALFPGVMPVALAAAGAAPPLGAIPLIYTVALAVSFDGSLGLNGRSYPAMHRWLSPFRGLRSPARFAALVALTLAILAGFGARRVLAWRPSRMYREAAFATLIALVMIEAWPSLVLGPVWREPPEMYRLMEYVPNAVLAEMPMLQDETTNLPYMYFSMWHWLPMVNGYSGFVPKSYQDLRRDIALFPAAEAVEALRTRGVTHVTVNCGFNYAGCDELIDAMRRARRLRLVATTGWRGFPVQLYEVLPP